MSLCKALNERGIDPIYGGGWYVAKLARMLTNPACYIGQTVWGKNSHGEYAQYVDGQYITPKRSGGKVKTGRKNEVRDWIFPKPTEVLISKELWDEVQKKLVGDARRKRGLRNPHLYLAGLVYCGRCGLRMAGWTHPKRSTDRECYCCETFRKFGHANAPGCRLHCTSQNLSRSTSTATWPTSSRRSNCCLTTWTHPAMLKR